MVSTWWRARRLIKAIGHRDGDMRFDAAFELAKRDKKAAPALMGALRHATPDVHGNAARALGIIGDRASSRVPRRGRYLGQRAG